MIFLIYVVFVNNECRLNTCVYSSRCGQLKQQLVDKGTDAVTSYITYYLHSIRRCLITFNAGAIDGGTTFYFKPFINLY